jgi:3-methyl-2-oxobutanoate hydroxymethyltransferase
MSKIREKFNQYVEAKNQIVCVTCYDASFSKILDDLKIDIVLVGDSLGMVIKGDDNTHSVQKDEILYHTACVAKSKKNFLLMSDMPINSYNDKNSAIIFAKKLLEINADIVKIEYQDEHKNIIKEIITENIPVCGHLGFLPQFSIKKEDIRVYGRTEFEHDKIFRQAKELENLGVEMILLECVDKKLSKLITQSVNIPVIGIGSGESCNGQVQVIYDIIGISKNPPRFAKNFLEESSSIKEAIKKFHDYVKNLNK